MKGNYARCAVVNQFFEKFRNRRASCLVEAKVTYGVLNLIALSESTFKCSLNLHRSLPLQYNLSINSDLVSLLP